MKAHLSDSEFVHALQDEKSLNAGLKIHLSSCIDCREELQRQRFVAARLDKLSPQRAPSGLEERVMVRLAAPRPKAYWSHGQWKKVVFISLGFAAIWLGMSTRNTGRYLDLEWIQKIMGRWGHPILKVLYEITNYTVQNILIRQLMIGFIVIAFFVFIDLFIQRRRKTRFF